MRAFKLDPHRCRRTLAALTASLACLAISPAARAAIDPGDAAEGGEFYMVLVDEAQKASYVFDLNLRTSTLLTEGQSDAGFQRFWTLDPAVDQALGKLLQFGTAPTALRWGVVAVDNFGESVGVQGAAFAPNELHFFTTLEHTVPTGEVNPNFIGIQQLTDFDLTSSIVQAYNSYANTASTSIQGQFNTFDPSGDLDFNGLAGSAFYAEGSNGYFSPDLWTMAISSGKSLLSAVNTSSWAYMLGNRYVPGELFVPILVDEFDNLTHDAFWGLAYSNGKLYLSYTLEGTGLSLAQASFMQSIGRTELNGGFSVRALGGVNAAGAETAAYFSRRVLGEATPMAAVPEPATWGLMGLGLLFTAAAAARRRQAGA